MTKLSKNQRTTRYGNFRKRIILTEHNRRKKENPAYGKPKEKEKEKLQAAVESLLLTKQNTKWSGQKEVIGNRGLPQSIADFDPSLLGMTLTDSTKRDASGN